MSVFSKISASKKQAQKLQDEKKQKAKADGEPKPKYMHTPKHAYVDALNCVAGPGPGNDKNSIREASERATERRKSRLSQHSSRTTMVGLHSANSSSTGFTTMMSNGGEAKRTMMQRDQLHVLAPVGVGSSRRSYQSSPLASYAPSTAGPSTVSSYEQLDMASLAPAPLRPSMNRRTSSKKKSVTIQDPYEEAASLSPTSLSSMSDKANEAPLFPVPEAQDKPFEEQGVITIKSTEIPVESSSEEEKVQQPQQKKNHRINLFWRKRSTPMVAVAG